MKNRVTGIGGIFFKTKNPNKVKNWYSKHLGLNTDQYGSTFWWKNKKGEDCSTQWSPMDEKTQYFKPSEKQFMINYRVENLEELLKMLKTEGVEVVGDMAVFEYGKFGWILNPEGHKIELWEPNDQAFLAE